MKSHNITRRFLIKASISTVCSQFLSKIAFGEQGYPYREFDIRKFDQVLIPRCHGQIRKLHGYYRSRYPSRDQSMQMMAFFNRTSGLYIQTKDPKGQVADWEIFPQGKLRITFYGSVPEIVVKNIFPDFRVAAEIYREWALQQYWAKKKSSYFDRISVVAVGSSGIDRMRLNLPNFLKKFKQPNACWLTQWRKYPFDRGYPNYQAKSPKNFAKFLQELHDNETIPFPYINGILWDENCKNPVFDKNKILVNQGGTLSSYNKKLNFLKLACPGTQFWQKHILDSRNSLLDSSGRMSKGVYYDVFTGTLPRLCFSKDHKHVPGDPLMWQQAVRNILRRTNGMIMVEANAEIYIDLVDAMLMHLYTDDPRTVPLWNEVYGTVVNSVGWIINPSDSPKAMLTSLSKAQKFGVSAWGSPWMTAKVQEKMLRQDYSKVLEFITSNNAYLKK